MADRTSPSIPLTPVSPAARAHRHDDAPYRAYIIASLSLAIFGGFALAVLLPLAQALSWDWGNSWDALVQVHGQLQLEGFAGLFVMGMALRLMPRFSGVPLAFPALATAAMPLIAASLVLRALAQPAADGVPRDAALFASAALLLAGASAFAAVVLRMLARPTSKADATGWFFVLGALSAVAAAALNAWLVLDMARNSTPLASLGRQPALIFLQLYGVVLTFVGGVSTRAVPTFTGRPRAPRLGRATAALLTTGVVVYVVASLRASYAYSRTAARAEDAGLLLVAAALLAVVWMTGVFHPRANRVGAATRYQFQLVRAALGWLAFASLLTVWYAVRALRDGVLVDSFEMDAIRHALTVGVLTMIILGMGMMILPEFAGRRIQHPRESWVAVVILVALNAAAVLRIWPAIEGLNWLSSSRYWPMAAAGVLAASSVVVFAAMFVQSVIEQRTPGWGATPALPARRKD
ncbi:MAG TPA: NnrS family protein [Dehalococcoidia bacterium]|nr:NnrS family protein [Dehalococcoidia bacterium]